MISYKRAHKVVGFTMTELVVALSISALILATGYESFKSLKNAVSCQKILMAETLKIMQALEQLREDLVNTIPTVELYNDDTLFSGSNRGTRLLSFYSFCVTDYIRGFSGIDQIHKIKYDLEREKGCLYRTSTPIFVSDKSGYISQKELLLDDIEDFRLDFYDGKKLDSSFSSKEQLPVYVRVTIAVRGEHWQLTVYVPCGKVKTEQV